jgi:hypothetical protein
VAWVRESPANARKANGETVVSRHHIQLPPVYTPPTPKLKETKRKRRVGYAQDASGVEETGETEEADAASATRDARPLPQQIPIEDATRKIPSPNGKLSDQMLKAMLEVQEEEGTKNAGSSGV